MHRLVRLALAVGFCVVQPALAGPGDLDVRFGTHGQAKVPGQLDSAALVVLPDGRILIFGKPEEPIARLDGAIAVARLLANGDPDSTFGSGGHLDLRLGSEPEPIATDALLLEDGRILVCGYFAGDENLWPAAAADQHRRTRAAGWVVRLSQDATIDPTFGVGGVARAGGNGLDRIALLPDGAIAVAAPGMLHRLESNGAPVFFPGSEASAVAVGDGYSGVSAIASLQDGSVLTSAHFSGPMDSLELHRVSISGVVSNLRLPYLNPHPIYIGSFAPDSNGVRFTTCGTNWRSLIVTRAHADGRPDLGFAPATGNRVELAVENQRYLGDVPWRESYCRAVLPGLAEDQIVVGDRTNQFDYGGGRIVLAHLDASGAIDAAFDRSGHGRELALGAPDQWSSWYVADAATAPDGAALFIARRTTAPPPNDYYFENELGEQRTLIARVEVSLAGGSGSLGFNDAAVRVAERQSGELRVYRSGGSAGAVSVRYELLHDTANEADIAPLTGTLTWSDSDASPRTIPLAPTNDTALEGEESFRIRLSAPTGGALLGSHVMEVTIEDDEALRAIFFAQPVSQVVEGQAVGVTITPPATPGPIVVRYALAADLDPIDGAPRPAASRLYRKNLVGELRWNAADASPRSVQVSTFGNGNEQPNDTIYVALADVSGTLREGNDWKVARVTVVDDSSLNPPAPAPPTPGPAPAQPAPSQSGGGALSIAALLLLVLTKLASALRPCVASRRRVRAECGDAV